MKIEYRKGNLLDTDVRVIMHGCNSHGVMGSGVAKAVRSKYPKAYEDYRKIYTQYGLTVGDIYISNLSNERIVINAITQKNYGSDKNTVYVSYDAIKECLRRLNGNIDELAMPMIGAGLANGDWAVISRIIEETLVKTKPIVYVLESEWYLVEKYL